MATGVELELCAMVVVRRPHRTDDGEVVHALANVRPPVADLDPAPAPLRVSHLERVNLRLDLVLARDELAQVLLQEGRVDDLLVRRLVERLAGVLVQCRLGVEALDVARPADHEQPDDVLGLRREVRLAVGQVPRWRRRATPSRWSIAPSASPVKPMPRSARNARRGNRRQLGSMIEAPECIHPDGSLDRESRRVQARIGRMGWPWSMSSRL